MQNDTHMRRIYLLIGFLTILLIIGLSYETSSPGNVAPARRSGAVIEEPALVVPQSFPSPDDQGFQSPDEQIPAVLPLEPDITGQTQQNTIPVITEVLIEIKNKGRVGFAYDPPTIQVLPGTKITIFNNAKIIRDTEPQEIPQYHKFTVQPGKNVEPSNVGPRLKTGESWSFTLTQPGRYIATNTLHAGSIIITVMEPQESFQAITGNAIALSAPLSRMPLFALLSLLMVACFAAMRIKKSR